MEITLKQARALLERTPQVLKAQLGGLEAEWTTANEGDSTWSAHQVVAHLLLCERTVWPARVNTVLSGESQKLESVDMTAHFTLALEHDPEELLEHFAQERARSLRMLDTLALRPADLLRTARHPTLGEVNLQQIIATWTAHDLSHTAQVARILAHPCKAQVGPFITFLKFFNR